MNMITTASERQSSSVQHTPGELERLPKGALAPSWLQRGVTAAWGLDGCELRLITVSENATFRVMRGTQPVAVLRVHRPGYVDDPRQVASELAWVEGLAADVDVPVPEVIHRLDGDTVSAIPDDEGRLWYTVMFAFVPGTILEDVTDPGPHFARIGEITARFHEQARSWRRPEWFTRFSWSPADMVGATARWGDWRDAALTDSARRRLERAERHALEAVAAFGDRPGARGLVHADLRPSNIMVGEDGALTIIDFDDCGNSWFLYDFASALSFMEHCAEAPAWASSWVSGYTSVTDLDDAELDLACALSMLRRLQMLGWTTTHRADALPAELWQAQISGTEEVGVRYLDNPRWLLS